MHNKLAPGRLQIRWLRQLTERSTLLAALALTSLVCGPAEAAINRFQDKFITIKPWVETASYGYDINSVSTPGAKLSWRPNTQQASGYDFIFHGFLGFGVGGLSPLSQQDKVLKGSTTYVDYRFSLPFPHFHLSANYASFHGFYLENTNYVNPSWKSGDAYTLAPNMESTNMSLVFTWIFNPANYSLEASLDQSVRQDSSGGSWLAGLSVAESSFTNDSALVPSSVQGNFGVNAQIQSARFRSLIASGGYGYTFILASHWYTTLQAMLGLGPQYAIYSSTTAKADSRGVLKQNLVASAGYNGDVFLIGAVVAVDAIDYRLESLDIPVQLSTFRVYLGARF